MSDSQNDKGVGEQFKDAVQKALDSGDFRQVNRIVANTVNGALSEAGRQIKRAAEEAGRAGEFGQAPGASGKGAYTGHPEWNGTPGKSGAGRTAGSGQAGGPKAGKPGGAYQSQGNPRRSYGGYNKQNATQNSGYYRNAAYVQRAAVQKPQMTPAPWAVYSATGRLKKVGQTSGTLMVVFGSIGTAISTLVIVFQLLGMVASADFMLNGIVSNAIVIAAFILLIQIGCFKLERIKRAKRYLSLFGGKNYCNIEDLALQMGRSRKFVLREIKRMMRKGFFPQGHLDEDESCLMLDDATYREYLQLQKDKKQQEAMEKAEKNYSAMPVPEPAKPEPAAGQDEELDALKSLVVQGKDCIRRLRDMNDAIDGEVISAKLFRLENVLKEIFGRVQEHPEQVPQMRKFMDYYLPTTLKLVQAYAEFDEISAPGEHILSAKAEIEETLDTINQAFEELLNKLFMDAAMDVTTDAQVLQTMLAQEGLTREKEFAPRSGRV